MEANGVNTVEATVADVPTAAAKGNRQTESVTRFIHFQPLFTVTPNINGMLRTNERPHLRIVQPAHAALKVALLKGTERDALADEIDRRHGGALQARRSRDSWERYEEASSEWRCSPS